MLYIVQIEKLQKCFIDSVEQLRNNSGTDGQHQRGGSDFSRSVTTQFGALHVDQWTRIQTLQRTIVMRQRFTFVIFDILKAFNLQGETHF